MMIEDLNDIDNNGHEDSRRAKSFPSLLAQVSRLSSHQNGQQDSCI